ncbi:hypothetical protein K435DRAFT_802860 [Dendrothele bispora CBS 962.96]|uniref:Myb-like domain-containing protein n=1 Tax=Dendrothele bispora (strain CBS 962.96) TaxID=1314807 RepID=A0A4S8LK66_DENBC|nr:hypothetical protein K435DRAFT_802860 [Dendrothele bispora CBS 962.96]
MRTRSQRREGSSICKTSEPDSTPCQAVSTGDEETSNGDESLQEEDDEQDTEHGEEGGEEEGEEEAEDNGQDSHNIASDDDDPTRAENRRKHNWKAWEDRFFVKELLVARPFTAKRGKASTAAWQSFSEQVLLESSTKGSQTPIDRSADSCKSRFLILMKRFHSDQARSMQKTGTDEEIDEFIKNLTELASLHVSHKENIENLSAQARKKITVEKTAGEELWDASMRSLIPREQLTDVTQLDGATVRERQGQQKRAYSGHSESDTDSNKENDSALQKPVRQAIEDQASNDEKMLEWAQACDEERFEQTQLGQQAIIDSINDSNARLQETMTAGFTSIMQGLTELAKALQPSDPGPSNQATLNNAIAAAILKKL